MQINIGGLIISVTFLLVYIVAPIGSLILGLYQLSSKKRVLTDMGLKVSNIKCLEVKTPNKILMGIMIFSTLLLLLINKVIAVIYAISIFQTIINVISNKKYVEANGVYENGIILGSDALNWNKVHSYKHTDSNFSILKKDGMRTEIEDVENVKNVTELLEQRNIQPEI